MSTQSFAMRSNSFFTGRSLVLAASLLLSGAVMAADPYVGIAVGSSSLDIPTAGAAQADTRSTGIRLFGGLQFGKHWGLEAAVFDLGKARGAIDLSGLGRVGLEGTARGLSIAGTFSWPVSDPAALYAKVGLAQVSAKGQARTSLGDFSQTESSPQPLLGAGLRWCFTPTWVGQIEWERSRVRFSGAERVNTDFLSIGLQRRF